MVENLERKTLGDFSITEVDSAEFTELARWIHSEVPPAEFSVLLNEAVQRRTSAAFPKPLQAISGDKTRSSPNSHRLAAAYFNSLPGGVATLGGLKLDNSYEESRVAGERVINCLIRQLRTAGVEQIQAVLSTDAAPNVSQTLDSAGFQLLTTVEHWWWEPWFGLQVSDHPATSRTSWCSAVDIEETEFKEFLSATFDGSLDCPALNGLRTSDQVLEGFLDGRELSESLPWSLLKIDGKIVGCVLMNLHPGRVLELAYIALLQSARGNQFGSILMQHALELSHRLEAKTVVVAVDSTNTPARKLYERFGFQRHRAFEVWLQQEQEPQLDN